MTNGANRIAPFDFQQATDCLPKLMTRRRDEWRVQDLDLPPSGYGPVSMTDPETLPDLSHSNDNNLRMQYLSDVVHYYGLF
jgi:hypothetical protein